MKKQITIIIFFWGGFISGQNSNNVKLAQEYYKNMTQEERDGEFPEGVTKIARVHNSASGYGYVIVDAESHEKLHGFMMSWAPMCTFPQVEAMIDDEDLLKVL